MTTRTNLNKNTIIEQTAGKEIKSKKNRKKYFIFFLILIATAIGFIIYAFLTKTLIFALQGETIVQEKNYTLDEFILNLNDSSGRRYIKTKLVLSYENEKDVIILEKNMPQMRDLIISIMRVKTTDEMMDVDKTEKLKNEIIENLNILLGNEIIINVYFNDFLIQ